MQREPIRIWRSEQPSRATRSAAGIAQPIRSALRRRYSNALRTRRSLCATSRAFDAAQTNDRTAEAAMTQALIADIATQLDALDQPTPPTRRL